MNTSKKKIGKQHKLIKFTRTYNYRHTFDCPKIMGFAARNNESYAALWFLLNYFRFE